MQLYSLTLQSPSAATHALQGNFSGPRVHEIVVARGRTLELHRLEDKTKLRTVWSSDVFGIIRSMTTFRLTGQNSCSLYSDGLSVFNNEQIRFGFFRQPEGLSGDRIG